MSRPMSISLPGLVMLSLAALLFVPGGSAEARDSRGGEAVERPRATEALNPAHREAGQVRMIRDADTNRRAYAYQVNGRERVSVAAPRRVDREPVRVQRQRRHVDDVERRATERASNVYHRTRTATRDASADATIVRAAHRPTARARAEAAVRHASLERHVQREVYAGYRHTPRSRLTGSIHYHTAPKYHYRSHRHRSHHWYDVPVSVGYHYHYSSRPRHRIGTSIGVHLGSPRYHCPPVRFHHPRFHHRGSSSRFSIHLQF